jgi:hypothetical protein
MDVLLVVCMLAWDGFISADQGKCEAVVTRYRTWALKMQKKKCAIKSGQTIVYFRLFSKSRILLTMVPMYKVRAAAIMLKRGDDLQQAVH